MIEITKLNACLGYTDVYAIKRGRASPKSSRNSPKFWVL